MQMQPDPARGTILLAHGSRDPLWRKPIEAVAEQMRVLAPAVHVRCAYLELSAPDLPASVEQLVTLGVTAITVVPVFFWCGQACARRLAAADVRLAGRSPRGDF